MAEANITLKLTHLDHRDDPRCRGALENNAVFYETLLPEFHQGGVSTLNVITIPRNPEQPGDVGTCTNPAPGNNIKVTSDKKQDGCAVAVLGDKVSAVIPVLAHEVFHWFGLQHVQYRSQPGGRENLMVPSTV